ncbi:MAG TPA: hypothetical protein VFE04_09515 [Puia sp.]|nr:hypothetical protein [Puia sp.]
MSSYLLLRNNQESGPFSLDEIKGMSLRTYDLIWVVGKSAAWRYPGEVQELISFAPMIPELPDQRSDFFRKKTEAESQATDFSNSKIQDSQSNPGTSTSGQRSANNRFVYINLPAEKKPEEDLSNLILEESGMIAPNTLDSDYNLSEIYKNRPSAAVRYSGKILWVSTIILLFGAGIMTGFFIADRRKYFSEGENHPQNNPALQQVIFKNKTENSSGPVNTNPTIGNNEVTAINADSVKKTNGIQKKLNSGLAKKITIANPLNKDSIAAEKALLAAIRLRDSLKQDALNKSEQLYQSIKSNPEKFLNLSTGHYSTGLFGGISSFPVTVTNHSPVKIAMVEVVIDYIQNNEKIFKTETLSFNDLEAGEELTMKAPKSSRGTKIATHIRIVNLQQPDQASSN